MSTTRTFEQFFDSLEQAYAMEIDDTIMLPVFEDEMDEEPGEAVVLYDEWNGSIRIPADLNKEIEFDETGHMFRVKGFSDTGSDGSADTFSIRFLNLA